MSGRKAEDIVGQEFGRWRVISRVPNRPGRRDAIWRCRCACGQERDIPAFTLRGGNSQSCGCLRDEVTKRTHTTHGQHMDSIYKVWTAIIQRCTNEKCLAYPNYGGRGIKISLEFRNSFETFRDYIGPRPSLDHSIDRIDNSGHYEKGNIRWATRVEQNRNKRTNRVISFQGKTLCLADWAKILDVGNGTLRYRIEHWSLERALAPERI